jgi:DNA-directed RNA polymerase alpha subunit
MFEWLKPSSKETETETEDANLQLSVHEELELSVRSLNGLQSAKIETIGQLVQRTEKDIMRLRFLGRKSLREIKQELARIGLTLAESESQSDEIYVSTLADSLEEKINVIEKATNIIDRHESQITQLVNRSRRTVHTVLELETTVKNLEEEIKQIKEKFFAEWKKQYELGVELSNRYRELAGK